MPDPKKKYRIARQAFPGRTSGGRNAEQFPITESELRALEKDLKNKYRIRAERGQLRNAMEYGMEQAALQQEAEEQFRSNYPDTVTMAEKFGQSGVAMDYYNPFGSSFNPADYPSEEAYIGAMNQMAMPRGWHGQFKDDPRYAPGVMLDPETLPRTDRPWDPYGENRPGPGGRAMLPTVNITEEAPVLFEGPRGFEFSTYLGDGKFENEPMENPAEFMEELRQRGLTLEPAEEKPFLGFRKWRVAPRR